MKHKKGNDINGWLIIDKPEGMGSTEVVNFTRRFFNARKNGHTGTLDPFATGVLPIAFGEATKLIDFLQDEKKEYEFTIDFGAETDTCDCTGTITAENEKVPSAEDIKSILPKFSGLIKQTPPTFSAVKINGQRAYNLARRGEKIEMPEREVEIFALELLKTYENHADFKVLCSKGTYVRSLGRDIAHTLNACGHLSSLRRTRSGLFTLNNTISLDKLKNIVYGEQAIKLLLPLETSLRDIAVMAVSEAEAEKLRQGQSLSPKDRDESLMSQDIAAAVCNGVLQAIVRIDERKISPIRVFNLTYNDKEDIDVYYKRS